MKFIHTSDWQIGKSFASLLNKGCSIEKIEKLREERLRIIDKIASIAKQKNVDFVIVAGDIFEYTEEERDRWILPPKYLEEVKKTLSSYSHNLKWYLIAGNHDPINAYVWKLWERCSIDAPNIKLLFDEKEEIIDDKKVVLFPCSCKEKKSTQDPTNWLRGGIGEKYQNWIKIVIAHGCIKLFRNDPNHPISSDIEKVSGADYIALGDWHSFREITQRIFYSGTPESTAFDEDDSGNILIVNIEKTGEIPQIEKIKTSTFIWKNLNYSEKLSDDIKNIANTIDSKNILININLKNCSLPYEKAINLQNEIKNSFGLEEKLFWVGANGKIQGYHSDDLENDNTIKKFKEQLEKCIENDKIIKAYLSGYINFFKIGNVSIKDNVDKEIIEHYINKETIKLKALNSFLNYYKQSQNENKKS